MPTCPPKLQQRRVLKKILMVAFVATAFTCVAQKKDIRLEDIWAQPTFRFDYVYGLNSMKDGEHYSSIDETTGNVDEYDYASGKKAATILKVADLVPEGKKDPIQMEDYQFSDDEGKLLLPTESDAIYRHSEKSNYYVYDRKSKKLMKLSEGGKQMYATFSPDASMVAFVRDNNIFIKELATNKEVQVTSDGLFNSIINGAADWVYEEEFSFAQAFSWSPDGKKIAFYKFDESKVKEFQMAEFGTLYPGNYKYKYPKAGETNSVVSIHIYDVAGKSTKTVNIGPEKDQYIARLQWSKDPNTLSLLRLNRLQNKAELLFANAQTGETKIVYVEESKTYVDIHESQGDFCHFLENKQQFIIMSERDGFNHLYLLDMNGNLLNQITKGTWDVMSIEGIDEKNKTIFYISTEVAAIDRDLYSVGFDSSNKKKLSTGAGNNKPDFSRTCKYYINVFSDANTPYMITLHNASGKQLRVLKDNVELKKKLREYKISPKEFFTFKAASGDILNGWMMKPADFNPNRKYPVFMTVYGGPGVNTVNNAWGGADFFWHQLMAQKGYIVISVDNRGTGGRGAEFKNCTYKQLGKLETEDQIDAAKYMGSLPYVDKDRIGIMGWSYGGYMSSLCITKGADYFKAAIAVAPVTNWRYYDTIYTERYLQTPQENASGYDENSPINFVSRMKGKYLLVHGTSDDNVHFQNTVEMVTALTKANKQFDLAIYPNKNHGIYGGNTRLQLYNKMTDFLVQNL